MIRIPNKFITAVLFSSASFTAHALPAQIITGDVTVDYDVDSFTLNVDGYSIDPATFASVIPVANGVRLEFGGYLSAYGSSYTSYSSETKTADYSALFSFAPNAGKTIAGYTITYTGSYSIETPGSVDMSGVGVSFNQFSGGSPFSIAASVGGPTAPALAGQLSATGDINYVQVFDYYEDQLVGYQQVLDYCDSEDPTVCFYHDEPIYEQVPVYHDEMDLGEANMRLESITLQANAVPVPGSAILLISALTGLGVGRMKMRGSR
jgi:hypothetical protein